MKKIRFIGDVHGDIPEYVKIANEAEYSIQVGDLGFDYSGMNLDPNKHFVVAGNHDNYETDEDGKFINQPSNFLGDYGLKEIPGLGDVFFLRGGYSIDQADRTPKYNYWREEELSYQKMYEAIGFYQIHKPNFVVTHECPVEVIDRVSTTKIWNGEPVKPSTTAKLLQVLFDIHKPKFWIFGHYHNSFDVVVKGTRFICLPILGYKDFEVFFHDS